MANPNPNPNPHPNPKTARYPRLHTLTPIPLPLPISLSQATAPPPVVRALWSSLYTDLNDTTTEAPSVAGSRPASEQTGAYAGPQSCAPEGVALAPGAANPPACIAASAVNVGVSAAEAIGAVMAMGFSQAQAEFALAASQGEVATAISILVEA